jgi:hypothetical protein
MQKVQNQSLGVNNLPVHTTGNVYNGSVNSLPVKTYDTGMDKTNPLPKFEEPKGSGTPKGGNKSGQNPEEESKFGRDEQALLASQIPAAANMFASLGRNTPTTFDRLDLDPVSLDQERQELKDVVNRAKKNQRQNVRGTATSAGDALAALSAGSAGLAGQEARGLASISAKERNTNTQLANQESMTNLNISNQEMIARQQDQAKRASVRNAALANMSDNTQGYLKDKTLGEESASYNKKLRSLLKTEEYQIIPDGDGGYRIQYKNPTKKDGSTASKTIKSED